MTTTKTKQTAANNAFLADVKHLFNVPLFKHLSAIVNAAETVEAGVALARDYVRRNITTNEEHIADLGSGKRYY